MQGLDDKFFQHMHEKRQGIRPAGRLYVVDTGVQCGMDWASPECRIQRRAFV